MTNEDKFEGKVIHIGEPVTIERPNKTPFRKSTIGVEKADGQIAFFENRKRIKVELNEGDLVTIYFRWAGSIKGDRMFNNIVISKIEINK